jgi:hypothetical protein
METGKIIKYAAIGAGVLLLINGLKKKERNPDKSWHAKRDLQLRAQRDIASAKDKKILSTRKQENFWAYQNSNPLSAVHPGSDWPRNKMLVNPYNWRHPYGTTTKNPLYAGNYDRKPKSTNVKCNECGHTFKKIIGARTYEIKCPKCNGYDVELA